MKKIKSYLTDTVLNMEHPRAQAMKEQLEAAAKSKGGELKSMEIMEAGVAVVEFQGADAENYIASELGKLPNVEVIDISPFEMQYERNRNLQKKIDSSRAKRTAKENK
jgi:hypothetical protein